MNKSLDIERNWIAVKGEEIKAMADSKKRARRAAEHLGCEYDEIIATPAEGVPHVF
jgi:hypothetical protein